MRREYGSIKSVNRVWQQLPVCQETAVTIVHEHLRKLKRYRCIAHQDVHVAVTVDIPSRNAMGKVAVRDHGLTGSRIACARDSPKSALALKALMLARKLRLICITGQCEQIAAGIFQASVRA